MNGKDTLIPITPFIINTTSYQCEAIPSLITYIALYSIDGGINFNHLPSFITV